MRRKPNPNKPIWERRGYLKSLIHSRVDRKFIRVTQVLRGVMTNSIGPKSETYVYFQFLPFHRSPYLFQLEQQTNDNKVNS